MAVVSANAICSIEDLKNYLCRQFPKANIWLFGSRAKGTYTSRSDIDVAIETAPDEADKLTQARFVIEESLIPQKVDLVNLAQAPYLRQIVEKEGIRWQ